MPPSIAVVVLDTLRYDAFSRAFDWLPGRRFSKAYSTSHWTVPAHASLHTGRYASEVGVHSKSPTLDCPNPTLAETLDSEGYQTRCFSANPNIVYWDGWERGFDEVIAPARLDPKNEDLVDWDEFTRDTDLRGLWKFPSAVRHCLRADCPTLPALWQGYCHFMQSPADGGTKAITERVRTTDFEENEFLFINLMETHTPYHSSDREPISLDIGDAFAGAVGSTDKIKSAYGASVEYLAETYRDLYTALNTDFEYIITLSDHGEMLGEDGMWNHGYGLYPELTHIPLIIDGPDLSGGTHTHPVSLLDVYQTTTELAGANTDSRGQNLLNGPDARAFLTEYHGFLPSHREQFERKGLPDDLYKKRDPALYGIVTANGEYVYDTHTKGLQGSNIANEEELHAQLDSMIDSINQRSIDGTEPGFDDDVEQRLEDLGYA